MESLVDKVEVEKLEETQQDVLNQLSKTNRSRAEHLGDLTKRYKALQDVLSATSDDEIIHELRDKYGESFRKFIVAHESYMAFETDDEKRMLSDSSTWHNQI